MFERSQDRSQGGFSLLELSVALSLVSLALVSVGMTLIQGIQQRRESFLRYRALSTLRDTVAEIQEVANLPMDLANQVGVGSVYTRYHGQTATVPELPNGVVTVTCFPNEAAVPTIVGGSQDLNFDGDSGDDLGNQSAGSDLKLVPMELSLSYGESGQTQTVVIHRLVTMTAR